MALRGGTTGGRNKGRESQTRAMRAATADLGGGISIELDRIGQDRIGQDSEIALVDSCGLPLLSPQWALGACQAQFRPDTDALLHVRLLGPRADGGWRLKAKGKGPV
jgi:hypothetical protein